MWLNNMAMATSGDYRIYFERNGQRFAHEIDPKTRLSNSASFSLTVQVYTQASMTADGLSTGLFVLGER